MKSWSIHLGAATTWFALVTTNATAQEWLEEIKVFSISIDRSIDGHRRAIDIVFFANPKFDYQAKTAESRLPSIELRDPYPPAATFYVEKVDRSRSGLIRDFQSPLVDLTGEENGEMGIRAIVNDLRRLAALRGWIFFADDDWFEQIRTVIASPPLPVETVIRINRARLEVLKTKLNRSNTTKE